MRQPLYLNAFRSQQSRLHQLILRWRLLPRRTVYFYKHDNSNLALEQIGRMGQYSKPPRNTLFRVWRLSKKKSLFHYTLCSMSRSISRSLLRTKRKISCWVTTCAKFWYVVLYKSTENEVLFGMLCEQASGLLHAKCSSGFRKWKMKSVEFIKTPTLCSGICGTFIEVEPSVQYSPTPPHTTHQHTAHNTQPPAAKIRTN